MLRGSVFISINSQLSRVAIDSVTGDADVLAALPLNRKTRRKRMHVKLLGF